MKWPTTIFGQKSNVSHEDLQGMFISGDFRTCCQPVKLVQFSAFTFWTFQLKQNAHQLRRRQVDNSPEKTSENFNEPTSNRRPSDAQGDDTFCTCPYGSEAATSRAEYFVTSPFTGHPPPPPSAVDKFSTFWQEGVWAADNIGGFSFIERK